MPIADRTSSLVASSWIAAKKASARSWAISRRESHYLQQRTKQEHRGYDTFAGLGRPPSRSPARLCKGYLPTDIEVAPMSKERGGSSPWTMLLWLIVIIIALTCINQNFVSYDLID